MQQQQHLCRYLVHVFVVRECFLRLAFDSFSLGHNSFPFSSQGNVSHKLQSKKRKNLSVLFFIPFTSCLFHFASRSFFFFLFSERRTKMVKPSFVTLFKGRRKEGKKKKAATYEIRKGKEEAEKKKTRISFLSFPSPFFKKN